MIKKMAEQKRLEELLEQNNDFDGGFHKSLVTFAQEAFAKLKELGDNAKVCDLHNYIVAAYMVGKERGIQSEIKLQAVLKKL
jgi:hypothetical protein